MSMSKVRGQSQEQEAKLLGQVWIFSARAQERQHQTKQIDADFFMALLPCESKPAHSRIIAAISIDGSLAGLDGFV